MQIKKSFYVYKNWKSIIFNKPIAKKLNNFYMEDHKRENKKVNMHTFYMEKHMRILDHKKTI